MAPTHLLPKMLLQWPHPALLLRALRGGEWLFRIKSTALCSCHFLDKETSDLRRTRTGKGRWKKPSFTLSL